MLRILVMAICLVVTGGIWFGIWHISDNKPILSWLTIPILYFGTMFGFWLACKEELSFKITVSVGIWVFCIGAVGFFLAALLSGILLASMGATRDQLPEIYLVDALGVLIGVFCGYQLHRKYGYKGPRMYENIDQLSDDDG